RKVAQIRLLHVPARDFAAVLEPDAVALDLLEHAQELLRVMLVVPGRADDDQIISPPVNARPVPGYGLDLPAALRKWPDREFVVDDEILGIAERQERDAAHRSE